MNKNTSTLVVEKNSELGKIVLKVLDNWKSWGNNITKFNKIENDKNEWGKPTFSLDDEEYSKHKPLSEIEQSWQHIMACTKKIIIVDGDKYDVVKARHGTCTKNGHIQFLVNEMENEYN